MGSRGRNAVDTVRQQYQPQGARHSPRRPASRCPPSASSAPSSARSRARRASRPWCGSRRPSGGGAAHIGGETRRRCARRSAAAENRHEKRAPRPRLKPQDNPNLNIGGYRSPLRVIDLPYGVCRWSVGGLSGQSDLSIQCQVQKSNLKINFICCFSAENDFG